MLSKTPLVPSAKCLATVVLLAFVTSAIPPAAWAQTQPPSQPPSGEATKLTPGQPPRLPGQSSDRLRVPPKINAPAPRRPQQGSGPRPAPSAAPQPAPKPEATTFAPAVGGVAPKPAAPPVAPPAEATKITKSAGTVARRPQQSSGPRIAPADATTKVPPATTKVAPVKPGKPAEDPLGMVAESPWLALSRAVRSRM